MTAQEQEKIVGRIVREAKEYKRQACCSKSKLNQIVGNLKNLLRVLKNADKIMNIGGDGTDNLILGRMLVGGDTPEALK